MTARPTAVPRDHGSISGFFVAIAIALVACAGLVIDGARSVGAYVSAADHAENAARAGAQELTSLRSGEILLDPARARAAAQRYLASHGVAGDVAVTPTRVTVTVSSAEPTVLLRIVGVSTIRATATRSADPVRA